jgi:hypothetical protein
VFGFFASFGRACSTPALTISPMFNSLLHHAAEFVGVATIIAFVRGQLTSAHIRTFFGVSPRR